MPSKNADASPPRPSATVRRGRRIPAPSPASADLQPAPAPRTGDIPWSYGENRITALPRDPLYLFVYWEISDEAIAAARARVNDPNAGCALRVYDTSFRLFDGLNAIEHWDIRVDRGANNWYIRTGRPRSTFHVDIGVLSGWGAFVPIARSGAAEMPADAVATDGRVEWSTVLRAGSGSAYRHRYVAPPWSPPPPAPSGGGFSGGGDLEGVFRSLAGEGWSRSEWVETRMDGRVVRWIRWSGPFSADRFPIAPAGAYSHVEILFQGERQIIRYEQGERYVYGPWRVLLEVVGSRGERRTIHQWSVRHRWTTEGGSARVETPAILRRVLGGERVTIERSGSEERLAHESWGSEVLQQGASEWRWLGASETLMGGASETQQGGASETFYLGASELLRQGASELQWAGASEMWALGASEGILSVSSAERP